MMIYYILIISSVEIKYIFCKKKSLKESTTHRKKLDNRICIIKRICNYETYSYEEVDHEKHIEGKVNLLCCGFGPGCTRFYLIPAIYKMTLKARSTCCVVVSAQGVQDST